MIKFILPTSLYCYLHGIDVGIVARRNVVRNTIDQQIGQLFWKAVKKGEIMVVAGRHMQDILAAVNCYSLARVERVIESYVHNHSY